MPASTQNAAFGRNVRDLREAKGLTSVDLAQLLDRKPKSVVALEAGQHGADLKQLAVIKRVLACSWEQLLKGCE